MTFRFTFLLSLTHLRFLRDLGGGLGGEPGDQLGVEPGGELVGEVRRGLGGELVGEAGQGRLGPCCRGVRFAKTKSSITPDSVVIS